MIEKLIEGMKYNFFIKLCYSMTNGNFYFNLRMKTFNTNQTIY